MGIGVRMNGCGDIRRRTYYYALQGCDHIFSLAPVHTSIHYRFCAFVCIRTSELDVASGAEGDGRHARFRVHFRSAAAAATTATTAATTATAATAATTATATTIAAPALRSPPLTFYTRSKRHTPAAATMHGMLPGIVAFAAFTTAATTTTASATTTASTAAVAAVVLVVCH